MMKYGWGVRDVDIIDGIEKAGETNRSVETVFRRLSKLSEEVGELNEAWLSMTSGKNAKDKNWNDCVEEAVDVMIMALDIGLTVDEEHKYLDANQRKQIILQMLTKKLAKWNGQLNDGTHIA